MSDDRLHEPHSRACGWQPHPHGPSCHENCPTCHGARWDRPAPPPDPAPTLFDGPPPTVVPVQADTIAEAFDLFHAANPWVYQALVRLARDLVGQGRTRIGIGMLFEVLRWHWYRGTTDVASEFVLNNNYRSRYSRLIMEQERDLAGIFETRKLTAA